MPSSSPLAAAWPGPVPTGSRTSATPRPTASTYRRSTPTPGTAGDQAFTFIGTDMYSGVAGELRYGVVVNGATTIAGDVNGDGTSALPHQADRHDRLGGPGLRAVAASGRAAPIIGDGAPAGSNTPEALEILLAEATPAWRRMA